MTHDEINADLDAFADHVRLHAYARAMNAISHHGDHEFWEDAEPCAACGYTP